MDSDSTATAAYVGEDIYGGGLHTSFSKNVIAKGGPVAVDEKNGGGYDDGDSRRGSRRTASLPETEERFWTPWRVWVASRECASETDSKNGCCRRQRRWARERKLERSWQRRSRAVVSDGCVSGERGTRVCECTVMVRPQEGCGTMICMDMEEVRACRDLGLEIPRDFTVEIPGGISGNHSGGDSPISGTGDDVKDIKAKLKLWAHAVAFVSATAPSGH